VPHTPLLARVNGPWVALLTLVLIVGVLWAAKAVLMPLALGIILAFTLTPLVRQFDRLRLPRSAGVALTMLLALGVVGGLGYVVFDQFTELSTQITQYTSSMRRKVADLRLGNDAAFRQFTRTVDRVTEQLDENATDLRRAQPVRVVPARITPIERVREIANMLFEPLASAFIVLVLVAFMLGQREDLRDRFIRLIGSNNVTLTTRLMDETAQRVSQFLVWQTLINIAFGTVIAAGLYWIGVPYAALWGGLTAVLRFVPYVGTLMSALIPATLAFATFPGWVETLQTLALFLTLDLVTAYLAEPVVFGQRTGVSSFALLISALFWIWVWGPVGLLLSTPLTVCIAVLGRHVRSLRFLAIIFGEEPALMPHVRFYQRLLARDEDEAAGLVERKLGELGPVSVIDDMLIPAVTLVIQHRAQNEITEEDAEFILAVTAETVQQIPSVASSADVRITASVVGLAARTPIDQLLLQMFSTALGRERIELIAADSSAEAVVTRAVQQRPAVICIAAISPTRGSEVRNYCRRFRSVLPDTKILVLRPLLADADASRSAARMKDAGADVVVTNARDAVEAIDLLMQERRPKPVAVDAALESTEESQLAQS
jgi:predicted PurR-regulated permease PerM